MNQLLKHDPNRVGSELDLGGGRYYARLSQSEVVPTAERGETFSMLLFEAFDAEWFDQHPKPEAAYAVADYFGDATLFVLQARVLPVHRQYFPALEQLLKMASEDEEPDEWFVFEAYPSGGRKLGENELPLMIFANLYEPGVEAVVKEFRTVEPNRAAQLRKAVSISHIPDASEADVDSALAGVAGANIEWAVVYDVGQGNAVGLCDGTGAVEAYFDLGGGVLANAGTFPTALTSFCFSGSPPIILSHWDFDHWSSANRDKRSHGMTWIAPRQPVGPSHLALITSIMSAGKLLLVPPGVPAAWRGQLHLEVCTGRGRNHSGLALTLSERANGGGERMLFPGDARYPCIPSFPPAKDYLSVVAPHHGADMRNRTVPACPGNAASRLVYSFGSGNSFRHPRLVTRQDHDGAGWHDPLVTTATSAPEVRETAHRVPGPLGHVLVGWKVHGTLPPVPCAGISCQLQAQQL